MRLLCPLLLLVACGGDTSDDDDNGGLDTTAFTATTTTDEPCDEANVEIDPLGPEDPVVGDQWTVWLRCDGATLAGATVLQFDPPEFATVDENVATFLMAGTAEMTMQVGGYRAEMDVTVTDQ